MSYQSKIANGPNADTDINYILRQMFFRGTWKFLRAVKSSSTQMRALSYGLTTREDAGSTNGKEEVHCHKKP